MLSCSIIYARVVPRYTVNYWMLQHSFSIGIGDTVADGDTMLTINETINRVRAVMLSHVPGSQLFTCHLLWAVWAVMQQGLL